MLRTISAMLVFLAFLCVTKVSVADAETMYESSVGQAMEYYSHDPKDDPKDGDGKKPPHDFFRIDCRYHNVEGHPGVNFCYASAVYRMDRWRVVDVHLGVGCDNQTIFNDKARVQAETTLDRFSPRTAATPGVEVYPQGQLFTTGTYTSELDIAFGRMIGLCYVHRMW